MNSSGPQNIKMHLAEFFSQPFPLLDDFNSKVFLIAFCGLFGSVFIYFYNPFNLMEITYNTALGRDLPIWSGGLIGSFILVLTQFFLRKIAGLEQFNLGQFILWVLFDFFVICIGIYIVFGESHFPFWQEFKDVVIYCVSLGIIPYLIACLFIAVYRQNREKRKQQWTFIKKFWFRDENEKDKLALSPDQILYLKSENNYTSVYYLENGKVERELIRNTLKKLEEQINFPGMVRIHRSYMVNLDKITSIHPTKKGYDLTMDQMPEKHLSVSESYKESFKSHLHGGPGTVPVHPK